MGKAFSFRPVEKRVEAALLFLKIETACYQSSAQKWYREKVYVLNDVFDQLREWNCDVTGALERFLNDEEMYLDFLHQIAEEASIVKLGKAIDEGDVQSAFDCAHTLKGVHGNMGLTPLYHLDIEIVEPLREGTFESVKENYDKLVAENEKLKEILR